MPPPFPGDCAARFEPVAEMGRGAYGAVWRARDRTHDRFAAVKLLHADGLENAEQLARFETEARVTAQIKHPHVVTVLDAGAATGVPWIAYELLEGRSLRDALDAGPLSIAAAIAAAEQIALALGAAHHAGVLHRDIKPDNVLAAGPDHWKVADFGIARCADVSRVKTATGVVMGTPQYIAPELIEGHPASPASDVYALGITLYELLTGEPPFLAPNLLDLIEQHLHEPPPLVSARRADASPALAQVVARALAKDPAARYASAGKLAAALGALSSPSGQTASPRPRSSARLAPGATAAIPREHDRPLSAVHAAPLAWTRGLIVAAALSGALCAAVLATRFPAARPSPLPPSPSAPTRAVALRALIDDAEPVSVFLQLVRRRPADDSDGRALELERTFPEASEMLRRSTELIRRMNDLAPLAYTNAPPDLYAYAFTAVAYDLYQLTRLAHGYDEAIRQTASFAEWPRRFPGAVLVELLDSVRGPLRQPERFAPLLNQPPPERADLLLLNPWCRLQARIARMLGHARAAPSDQVDMETVRRLLKATRALGRPGALETIDPDLLAIYDDRVLTAAVARSGGKGSPLADAQTLSDFTLRAQHLTSAYDALHLAVLGWELESNGMLDREEQLNRVAEEAKRTYPVFAAYVAARRAKRDRLGILTIDRFNVAMKALIACAPPADCNLKQRSEKALFKRWSTMVRWTARELIEREQRPLAETGLNLLLSRLGPRPPSPFEDEPGNVDLILHPNQSPASSTNH